MWFMIIKRAVVRVAWLISAKVSAKHYSYACVNYHLKFISLFDLTAKETKQIDWD